MGLDDVFCTRLFLGLGFPDHASGKPAASKAAAVGFEPDLTLSLSGETQDPAAAAKAAVVAVANNNNNKASVDRSADLLYRQDSAASSYSNASVKRERESDEGEIDRVSPRVSDEDDDGANGRKKLRLSKGQSALLEESFKQHSTLNPKQKQDLARELNLRPRQVEVWFQNRRARTKLKQTEVDCEYLKKCCETLTEENRRLAKEVQELKALKMTAPQPVYMQLPAATLSMCPSCERIGAAAAAVEAAASGRKSPFTMAPKPHNFFNNPFITNPSAAC
ncbi:hypothetical protein DM860_004926 [Cuscuta australis]|uniref:Homeobox domain-containing protein n=1 Tax=Cuscuta australis TaxID=267555 RepID=A0A328DLW2_9ASTE|nr:hypothetical protein DM860_004926 [Cuscuta australis]